MHKKYAYAQNWYFPAIQRKSKEIKVAIKTTHKNILNKQLVLNFLNVFGSLRMMQNAQKFYFLAIQTLSKIKVT